MSPAACSNLLSPSFSLSQCVYGWHLCFPCHATKNNKKKHPGKPNEMFLEFISSGMRFIFLRVHLHKSPYKKRALLHSTKNWSLPTLKRNNISLTSMPPGKQRPPSFKKTLVKVCLHKVKKMLSEKKRPKDHFLRWLIGIHVGKCS